MEYTDKELKLIKAKEFDKGWRYGILIGISAITVILLVIYMTL